MLPIFKQGEMLPFFPNKKVCHSIVAILGDKQDDMLPVVFLCSFVAILG